MNPVVVTAVLLLVGALDTVTGGREFFGGGGSSAWNVCEDVQPCGDGWSCIDEKRCIKYFKSPKTFSDAQEHCSTFNADLVSVHSYLQMDKLISLTRSADPELQTYWIGGQRSGDQFTYTDGSDFGYTRWYGGQPDNAGGQEDCIEVDVTTWGYWNDANCSKENYFICSKNM